MSLSLIRNDLETRLATISGLTIYHEMPEAVASTPAVLVKPENADYYTAMGSGMMHTFSLTVLVSLGQGHQRAQAQLDDYLAFEGSKSIRQAVEGDQTLAGACDTLKITRYYEYGGHEYAGTTYLGARIECQVWE